MSLSEKKLNKSEREVLQYIENETEKGKNELSESLKSISEKLNTSEATVHRAVSKLSKYGYVGVIASSNKYKSNIIVYYGNPVSPENLSEEPFFDMLMEFNQRANRFKSILSTYQREYELLKKENEKLREGILPEESFIIFEGDKIFESDIVGQTAIDEEFIAYIVKKK